MGVPSYGWRMKEELAWHICLPIMGISFSPCQPDSPSRLSHYLPGSNCVVTFGLQKLAEKASSPFFGPTQPGIKARSLSLSTDSWAHLRIAARVVCLARNQGEESCGRLSLSSHDRQVRHHLAMKGMGTERRNWGISVPPRLSPFGRQIKASVFTASYFENKSGIKLV